MKAMMRIIGAAIVLALCASLASAQFGGGGPFSRGGGGGGSDYGGGQRESPPPVFLSGSTAGC